MSDSKTQDTHIDPSPSAPKRAWSAPKLEEVDYAETEVGAGGPNPTDFTTYAS